MLSTAALYALRAMVHLAENPEKPQTAQDITSSVGIQSEYLAKIMGQLSRAGYVSSRRGRGGGFLLRHDPQDITLFDVATVLDPLNRVEDNVLQPAANDRTGKKLRSIVDLAVKDVEKRLTTTTLADVAVKKRR